MEEQPVTDYPPFCAICEATDKPLALDPEFRLVCPDCLPVAVERAEAQVDDGGAAT